MTALYTACLTVLIGVSVFVLGQIIMRFFIDPIHEQWKQIHEVGDSLIFYAYEYGNPGNSKSPRMDAGATEASRSLRRNATQLISKTNAVPWYSLWSFLRFVYKREVIQDAFIGLIYLSNAIATGDPIENIRKADQVRECLRLGIKEECNK